MEDYGIPGALILREFPFAVRGNTEALEPGEIICSLEKDRLRMELQNVSGREFQELCDLCLWVKLDSSEHCRELEDMLRQMDWRDVYKRQAYMEELCQGTDYKTNMAYMDGALQYIAYKKGANVSVMMPYACLLYTSSGTSWPLNSNARPLRSTM